MEYILSLSYGKDSLACLGAIEALGWPLDRIVHAEVWATDTIPADLPPMVEFKAKADRIIKERWGIEVEHSKADYTYQDIFYKKPQEKTIAKRLESGKPISHYNGGDLGWPIYGFPTIRGPWCNSKIKMQALKKAKPKDAVSYVGIAADEPNRFHSLSSTVRSPLVEEGWTEAMCRKWCEENDLLSPIYTTATRGGCWFCHNQGVDQLRLLRRDYPEYWALLLKWDLDSPVTFKPDGHTTHKIHGKWGTVYVLTNHGSTIEQDLHRIYTVRDLGYNPYVMVYDKPHAPQITKDLQRWCNAKWIIGACPDFGNYNPRKEKP